MRFYTNRPFYFMRKPSRESSTHCRITQSGFAIKREFTSHRHLPLLKPPRRAAIKPEKVVQKKRARRRKGEPAELVSHLSRRPRAIWKLVSHSLRRLLTLFLQLSHVLCVNIFIFGFPGGGGGGGGPEFSYSSAYSGQYAAAPYSHAAYTHGGLLSKWYVVFVCSIALEIVWIFILVFLKLIQAKFHFNAIKISIPPIEILKN